MSRWSRDRLRIALAPGGLALLRDRGDPAAAVARKSVPSEHRDAASLLPLLERELADPAWRCKHVEVILSNHFVRYVVTSPPGKALSQDEETALVGASFREIYGNETSQWRIRVASQPPQWGLVGAAVDEALVTQLETLARHHQENWSLIPLASLAAPHKQARHLDWWVLVEPGWMCLFHLQDGRWQHLNCQPVGDDWRSSLAERLGRETRMAGLTDTGKAQTAWIHAVGVGPGAPPRAPGWEWRIAPQGETHGVLALALA